MQQHIVAFSISQGDVVNCVADCTKDEVLECFANWEPEAKQLLDLIDNPTKWGIHHLQSLPFFVANRVVLLGDAAHGMSPHLGAGAGQAIEDAYILASVLGDATASSLDAALEAYQQTRLPVANHVLKSSYESGMMFEFNSRFAEDYTALGPAIKHQWDFLTQSTPEGEAEKAVEILRNMQES